MLRQNGIGFLFLLALLAYLSGSVCPAEGSGYEYQTMWPKLEQSWYFVGPTHMAVDSKNHIYLVDRNTYLVHKLTTDGALITQWGGSGKDNGKFDHPAGIAVDHTDTVFVVDKTNHNVQTFSAEGVFQSVWGSAGVGPGQFDVPECIAADLSGNVYVTDSGRHRVQKFAKDGTFLDQWGGHGDNDGEFDNPTGIAVDGSGNVYVVDSGNNRVQKFTSKGEYLTQWEFVTTNPTSMNLSNGIAVDPSGDVYVASVSASQTAVKKYTPAGKLIEAWGNTGSGDGQFYLPTDIAVDKAGKVYVVEYGKAVIRKFTADGGYQATWGSRGDGQGRFTLPGDVAVDPDGYVFVVDGEKATVQKFTPEGVFMKEWGCAGSENGQFTQPSDIAVDHKGSVFVSDSGNHRIQKFTSDGIFVMTWGAYGDGPKKFEVPRDLAIDADGFVYVTDGGNNRVQKFTPDGDFILQWDGSSGGGEAFVFPHSIAVDASGDVYVGDDNINYLQKFTSSGTFLAKCRVNFGSVPGPVFKAEDIGFDPAGNLFIADSIGNRILKTNPDNSGLPGTGDPSGVTVTSMTLAASWGRSGFEPGEFRLPSGVAVGIQDQVYVADRDNRRIQVFSTDTVPYLSKAVIVAGGGPGSGNNLWDATQLCANHAYRVLKHQGYTKETVYYLTSDLDLDLDIDGVADDADADATIKKLESAVTDWAKDASDLVIYLTDHGGKETFKMKDEEHLTAQQLGSWLDTFQDATQARVTIVYDACKAGSFIGAMSSTEYERIFISSTSHDQPAHFASTGHISFSYFFWGGVFNGMSVYDAYIHASNAVDAVYPLQSPLLNADGNTSANEKEDLEAVQTVFIGKGIMTAGDIPVIGSVSGAVTLQGGTQATISASNVLDLDGISRVWAIIITPEHYVSDPETPVLGLPEVELHHTSGNTYEGTYDAFTQKGKYHISVLAADADGVVSLPKTTSVTQTLGQCHADLSPALNLLIPCVGFQGQHYRISLNLSPSGGPPQVWELDGGSIGWNPDWCGDCAALDQDFRISLPRVEYQGGFYQAAFKRYVNPADPFGDYWVLDSASVAPQ